MSALSSGHHKFKNKTGPAFWVKVHALSFHRSRQHGPIALAHVCGGEWTALPLSLLHYRDAVEVLDS